jgi:mannose-6-phosphate isomerase-like protein (cupin superfamily)
MAQLLPDPTILQAAGTPPKTIAEFVGRLATGTSGVSIAVMHSPAGWSEPGQRPQFDEYTVVIEGEVLVETDDTSFTVAAGQASVSPAGQSVRYSTPTAGGARYVAVCVPAFAPDAVHRDDHTSGTP